MLRHFAPILMSDPTYNTDHHLYGAILFHVYTIPISNDYSAADRSIFLAS